MLKIFVNTWANYNENGADGGRWITLPMDWDDLDATLTEIAESVNDIDPEFCIHDYEWTGFEYSNIGENDNIRDLNDTVSELDALDDHDQKKVAAILEACENDLQRAINNVDDYTLYEGMDIDEVAEQLVEDMGLLDGCGELVRRYFDYEAFARDLRFDGYYETAHGVLCE